MTLIICESLREIGEAACVTSAWSSRGQILKADDTDALEMFRVELDTMALDSPNMYPSTLEEIKAETQADPTLSGLCAFVAHGWRSDKSQVPTALRHYYPLRDELAVYHGVLYKSHKVLIPVKLQSTMLKKLHHGHQGGESMIRGAREVMCWPGKQAAILQESVKCSLCASYGSKLPKEPMLSHEIPQGLWKFISQDLFKHGGRWYSVTVDHYSDWFEVDLLNEDITAANVISVTKAHFPVMVYRIHFCHTMELGIPFRNVRMLQRPMVSS